MSGEAHGSTERLAATAACARALADHAALPLALAGAAGHDARARADAIACHYRFRLPAEAVRWRPTGAAGTLFDGVAEARAEAVGARRWPGMGRNLAWRELGAAEDRLRGWAFAVFMEQDADPTCPPRLESAMTALRAHLAVPETFARHLRDACEALVREGVVRVAGSADVSRTMSTAEPTNPGDNGAAPAGDGVSDGAEQTVTEASAPPGVAPPPLPTELAQDYGIYTSRYDRVLQASDLATPLELAQLRARLDGVLAPHRQLIARLARQLQRVLWTRQRRHWQPDQDEGVLDPSRLPRLVADPSSTQVFRTETESEFRQTAVTLLLDNSGSMRGHAITVAALTADILAASLERCGIKVEVLGYTTATSDDGPVRRDWERNGSPPSPGRLTALRHIVYKAMDAPWRRARRHLGVMLKEGVLQENIDGEALWWACQRLLNRPEPRRLLIVVSDGAPMDKSTLAANPRDFLDRHLHRVIAHIEQHTGIELYALGIGHPVGRYYRRSVSLMRADDLGPVLLQRLREWLV